MDQTTCRSANRTVTVVADDRPSPPPSRSRIGKTTASAGAPQAITIPAERPSRAMSGYKAFAKEFCNDLAPKGPVQTFLAERAAFCAWRLKKAMAAAGADPHRDDKALEKNEEAAEKAMYKALDVLAKLQEAAAPAYGEAAPADSKAGSAAPEVVIFNPYHDEPVEGPADLDQTWRDRLTIDESVDDESPIVKGTFVTVRHVISLIVDGWSWAAILKTHPELTQDDLRACMDYSAEVENASLERYRGAMEESL